jgi:hypothetical protein
MGPRRGRSHVLEGSQNFVCVHTCEDYLSFKRLFPEPLSLLEGVRMSKAGRWSMTISARENRVLQ